MEGRRKKIIDRLLFPLGVEKATDWVQQSQLSHWQEESPLEGRKNCGRAEVVMLMSNKRKQPGSADALSPLVSRDDENTYDLWSNMNIF